MASLNKAQIIGNLGADPDIRVTQAGKQVAELRVATSFGQGESQQTEWHSVVLWEKLADLAQKFLKKGSKVYIEGRIQTRTYEDKEGATRYKTEIVGQQVVLLSPKQEEAAAEPEPAKRRAKAKPAPMPNGDDELFGD